MIFFFFSSMNSKIRKMWILFLEIVLLRSVSDSTLKNALIVCENAYKVVNFGEGIQSFAQRDYKEMLVERIAPRAQASCDIGY